MTNPFALPPMKRIDIFSIFGLYVNCGAVYDSSKDFKGKPDLWAPLAKVRTVSWTLAHAYVCMHICIYIYIITYLCVRNIFLQVYIYILIYIYMCVHTHLYMGTFITYMYLCGHSAPMFFDVFS